MLNIGNKIIQLRKLKSWSQDDLAKAIDASRSMIGKYERNENTPSIDMAIKMAEAFEVSLDYLIGKGQHAAYDKKTIERLKDIEELDNSSKSVLFQVIDAFLRDHKTRQAYS